MSFPISGDFFLKGFFINLGGFSDPPVLMFVPVRQGFDVGPVQEDGLAINESTVNAFL
nr:hypothetical protein [Eubacterium barkeri]